MIRLAALAALASLATSAPAWASCDAANTYSFAFASQAAATLGYGSAYSYTATSGGGAARGFTVALAQNGLSSTTVANTTMPAISALVTGADASKRDLVVGGVFGGRTADVAGSTRVITVTFTFATPVRDFAMTLHDIDFASNQYRDWLMVTGSGGGTTYTPVLSSSFGNGNATGSPRTATGSSVAFGPGTGVTLQQALGSGASDNNSDTGIVQASFAQPVTAITVRYGNAPLGTGETATGQQAIGIAGVSFCPMPAVAVTKTSAPIASTLGAYALPGNDVLYTFTVTNAGGSPVDAGTIVLTDVLPAGVTFRNTVLDAATGTPFQLAAGSSGVTLSAATPSYSADGGATWGYAPASGYDANVKAIRLVPGGTMAASSSFTISFVGRVN